MVSFGENKLNLLLEIKTLVIMKITRNLILLGLALLTQTVFAYESDSLRFGKNYSKFIGLSLEAGTISPTNDFIENADDRGIYSVNLKYGYKASERSPISRYFGMPYIGIGMKFTYMPLHDNLGYPMTPYLFQGATMYRFNKKLALNYEWNLGMSFNWKTYDPFTNRENIAISSAQDVHIAFIPYLDWQIADNSNLKLGLSVGHYSNGSTHQPNYGINFLSSYLEYDYSFGEEGQAPAKVKDPTDVSKWNLDYMFTLSSRQIMFDTAGTGLLSKYIDHKFTVLAFTLSPYRVLNHRFKYGVGLDVVYDESVNARAWREYNTIDKGYYDRVELGPIADRFVFGASGKGELTMPYYSIYGSLGYNFIQKEDITRLYQMIGVRLYMKENLYAGFAIRAIHFGQAYCFYWSVGYTLWKEKEHRL